MWIPPLMYFFFVKKQSGNAREKRKNFSFEFVLFLETPRLRSQKTMEQNVAWGTACCAARTIWSNPWLFFGLIILPGVTVRPRQLRSCMRRYSTRRKSERFCHNSVRGWKDREEASFTHNNLMTTEWSIFVSFFERYFKF